MIELQCFRETLNQLSVRLDELIGLRVKIVSRRWESDIFIPQNLRANPLKVEAVRDVDDRVEDRTQDRVIRVKARFSKVQAAVKSLRKERCLALPRGKLDKELLHESQLLIRRQLLAGREGLVLPTLGRGQDLLAE